MRPKRTPADLDDVDTPAPGPAAGGRSGRPAVLAAVLALVAAWPLTAQEPQPDGPEPDTPEVEEVRFTGARALDEDLLRATIVTRATECKSPLFFLFCSLGADWAQRKAYLDTIEVARDEARLETLYEIWGYPDAAVTARVATRGGDAVAVEFSIVEGAPVLIASLEIRGLDTLEPPVRLPERLPLRVGEPYALPRLDSLRQLIARRFAERGRPYATVEIQGAVNEAARTVDLVLIAAPGPRVVFGPATIEAARPIDEDVVRERLAFEPGEPFRPSALEETQRQLYRLPVVERVVIEPRGLEARDTVVSPHIAVTPGRTSAIQVEGTVSSSDCLELAAFWRNRYFLGRPRLFSLGVGFSNLLASQLDGGFPCTSTGEGEFADPDYFVEAELRQPWPGHPRTTALASVYFARESAPQAYVRRGYGGRFGVAREFRPDLTGSLQYAPQRNELDAADIYFCGNFGVCSPDALEELTDFTWLSPVEAFVLWIPTGSPLVLRRPAPGERWRRWVRGAAEAAAPFTGSDYDYGRTIGEGALTRILGPRSEIAGRTRLGVLLGAEDVLPPQVRIYSGGVNTVRGVAQNLLGPKILVAALDNLDALGCAPVTGGCPAGTVVDPDLVGVRPTGGEAVVEANLEARLWASESLQLAAFTDFGMIARDLGGGDDAGFPTDDWDALVTPGVGIRILTGLGPIRVDVGYDPSGARRYPLLTRDPETRDLIFLGDVAFDPYTFDDPGFWTELWRRLQLHVAIGQPF